MANRAAGSNSSAAITQNSHRGMRRRLPPKQEHDLLRISQEAVNNALKHAQARSVVVELDYETEQVVLRVCDDGKGFDVSGLPATGRQCFGLIGMHERARSMGGDIMIRSRIGEGTEVRATLSLEQKA